MVAVVATQAQRRRNRAEKNKRLWEEQQEASSAQVSVIAAIDREITASTPWPRRLRVAPIDLLHNRGSLSDRQHEALSRLARNWTNGQSAPRVVGSLQPSLGPCHDEPALFALRARGRFERAMQALPVEYRNLVETVALHEEFVTEWEARNGVLPSRPVGLDMLREAADILADHHKIDRDPEDEEILAVEEPA